MRKTMMILTALLLILLTAITAGCKTVPTPKVMLPPKPNREKQEVPKNIKDYASLVLYYDTLVQEWELWGDTVEKMIQSISD